MPHLVESQNKVIRKKLETIGASPTEEAAKRACLAFKKYPKGDRSLHEWIAARNQMAIMFKGSVTAA